MLGQNRTLNLYFQTELVGQLSTDKGSVELSFIYDESWARTGFPLSPHIPCTGDFYSDDVTYFFQNLLPEGTNLDDIVRLLNISKREQFEILRHIGSDMSGAFILSNAESISNTDRVDRPLPYLELSKRLKSRNLHNFIIWDGKIRVSAAGFQDKIGVKFTDGQLSLPEGIFNHTSHILKPPPINNQFESMVANEYFCMQLSQAIGLNTANTTIIEVPEPVLLVERFDRKLKTEGGFIKIHNIDGCQLLGLPANLKVEQIYGSGNDVAHIREGASIVKLAQVINQYSCMPIVDTANFLQWIAFQLCIGNVDAHAKNLSFFINNNGKTRLAPFYDQVCILDLGQKSGNNTNELDLNMAMAIGDEFDITKIGAYDIALMAKEAGFPVKSVISAFTKIAKLVLEHVDNVEAKDYYQRHHSIKQIICQLSEQLLDSLKLVNEAYRDL